MHWCTYLFSYLHSWLEEYKISNISETAEDRAKGTITVYSGTADIMSYTGFRLPPKCMALNDLWARFKVIGSLNAAKWRNTA